MPKIVRILLQEMAEDFDIEALLEAPYNKGVRKNIFNTMPSLDFTLLFYKFVY